MSQQVNGIIMFLETHSKQNAINKLFSEWFFGINREYAYHSDLRWLLDKHIPLANLMVLSTLVLLMVNDNFFGPQIVVTIAGQESLW